MRSLSLLLKFLTQKGAVLPWKILRGRFGNYLAPAFSGFDDALKHCAASGYQEPGIAVAVVAKTLIANKVLQQDNRIGLGNLRAALALAAVQPTGGLTVVDFGGGAGFHFSTVRKFLGLRFPLTWHVVETEEMAGAAARVFGDDSLKFFSTLDSAVAGLGMIDLVYVSGSLPYVSDPLLQLRDILSLGAKHVFVTRNVLTESDETLTVIQVSRLGDHGPGPLPPGHKDIQILTPLTIIPREKFERELERNYNIRFVVREDKEAYRFKRRTFDMFGYFLDLKKME